MLRSRFIVPDDCTVHRSKFIMMHRIADSDALQKLVEIPILLLIDTVRSRRLSLETKKAKLPMSRSVSMARRKRIRERGALKARMRTTMMPWKQGASDCGCWRVKGESKKKSYRY